MGDWKTHVDGEKVTSTEQDEWVQEKEYATIAERDAASAGWGSAEIFRQCKVVETGFKYYWNGASWTRFPATGGAGAPIDAPYVVTALNDELTSEVLHNALTGANLHVTKAHKAEHENAGADEIDVTGLNGVLVNEQDAGKIKGKTVDDAAIGDNKVLAYDLAGDKVEYIAIPGGGDMTKAVYDTDADNIVDNSEKLEGSTKAEVQTHTPATHKDTHKTGGGDPFAVADLLDGIARTTVRKNTGANVGSRRRINFIEGAGTTLTVTDDVANEEVDVNIGVSGGAAHGDYTYLIYYSAPNYYAEDWEGNIVYGGPDDAGGVDGADPVAVINACLSGGNVTVLLKAENETWTLSPDASARIRVESNSVLMGGGKNNPKLFLAANRPTGQRYAVIEVANGAESFRITGIHIDGNGPNQASYPATNSDAWFLINLGEPGAGTVRKYWMIDHCYLENGNSCAIDTAWAQYGIISDNFWTTTYGGVWLDTRSQYVTVVGNVAYANKTRGIAVASTDWKTAGNVAGAVADDGGAQTDETTATNNDTANDMTLLPATPAVNDAYYFGGNSTFWGISLRLGTPGVGTWALTWEYWNGAWTALSNVIDKTKGFTNHAGFHDIFFTVPGDWATTTVGGIASKYWVRARVSSYTSVTTQPLGTRGKIITGSNVGGRHTIVGNVCVDNEWTGIFIYITRDVVIADNVVFNNASGGSYGGIYLEWLEHGVCKGNICVDNNEKGINMTKCIECSVTQNICYNTPSGQTQQWGIREYISSDKIGSKNVIADNTVFDNTTAQIRVQGVDNVIKDNIVSGTQGISLYGQSGVPTYMLVQGNKIENCVTGLDVDSDDNIVEGNYFRNNTADLADAGSNNVYKRNFGYVTENNVLSGTFAIDSTGLKSVTISHGCDYTPAAQDVQATISEDTDVDDWWGYIAKVKDITSTQLTVDVYVADASATGAATAKVSVRVARE